MKLDSSTTPTTGKITQYKASNFATSNFSKSARGVDLNITLGASRSVYIEAEIIAGSGARTEVVFSQDLEYLNVQNYFRNFTEQVCFCERPMTVTVRAHFGPLESFPGRLWSCPLKAQRRDNTTGQLLISSHRQFFHHITGRLELCVLSLLVSPRLSDLF